MLISGQMVRMMQENIFSQRTVSEDNFILKELDTFGHIPPFNFSELSLFI